LSDSALAQRACWVVLSEPTGASSTSCTKSAIDAIQGPLSHWWPTELELGTGDSKPSVLGLSPSIAYVHGKSDPDVDDLLHKDSTLAMEMAHVTGTPLFLMKQASSLFTWYQLEGLGDENWSKMMTVWEKQLGIRIGGQAEE
jgi:hypothetical protein